MSDLAEVLKGGRTLYVLWGNLAPTVLETKYSNTILSSMIDLLLFMGDAINEKLKKLEIIFSFLTHSRTNQQQIYQHWRASKLRTTAKY